MSRLQQALGAVIAEDPGRCAVVSARSAAAAASREYTGRFFISLKPRDERGASADQIIDRLRPQLARVPGVTLFLQAAQDVRVGGRSSRSQFQYTLQDANRTSSTPGRRGFSTS